MNDASKSFNFANFVPGFDFLKNLAGGGAASAASAVPGLPGLGSWVAPTLSVEEVDKRIQELRTVQFWLDQNLTALKATIQALEVQKMTLSTLKGMNLRMEDLANSFTRAATVVPAPPADPPPPQAAAEPEPEPKPVSARSPAPAATSAGGVVDPLQWWGALTQQFEQIASSALRDAASLKVPTLLQTTAGRATEVVKKSVAGSPDKKPAAAAAGAKKKAAPRRPAASTGRAAPGRR